VPRLVFGLRPDIEHNDVASGQPLLKTDLQAELEALFNAQNASPNGNATSIPATFLRVTVSV
jgi:hypothetical protein